MKTEDKSQLCYKTTDKILNVLEELGYTTERKPSYPNELRDLIAIEICRAIKVVDSTLQENLYDD